MMKHSTLVKQMATEAAIKKPLPGGPSVSQNKKRRTKAKGKLTNAEILERLGATHHIPAAPKSPRAANNNKRINKAVRQTKAFFAEGPKGTVPSSEQVVNVAAAAVIAAEKKAAAPAVEAGPLNIEEGSTESTTEAGEPALPINNNNEPEVPEAVEGQPAPESAALSQSETAEPAQLNKNEEEAAAAEGQGAAPETPAEGEAPVVGEGIALEPPQQDEAPQEEAETPAESPEEQAAIETAAPIAADAGAAPEAVEPEAPVEMEGQNEEEDEEERAPVEPESAVEGEVFVPEEPAQQADTPVEPEAIEAATGPKDAEGLLLAASGAGEAVEEEGKEADGDEVMSVHDIDAYLDKPIPATPFTLISGAAMLGNAVVQTVRPIAKGLYAAGARISASLGAAAGMVAAGACRVAKAVRALGARIAAFVRSVVARVAAPMA